MTDTSTPSGAEYANMPRTAAGRELLASIFILVSGKPDVEQVREWSRRTILAIEAQAYEKGYRDSFADGKAEAADPTPAAPLGALQAGLDARREFAQGITAPTPAEPLTSGSHEPEGLDVKRLARALLDEQAAIEALSVAHHTIYHGNGALTDCPEAEKDRHNGYGLWGVLSRRGNRLAAARPETSASAEAEG